jgi:YD repeat-containing protein
MIRVDEVTRLGDDGIPGSDLKNWTTSYLYDLNDRLTRITDSQGNVKTMVYDGLKRKTFMDDLDCGRVSYTYDDASNLKSTVDAKAQQVVYTYDGVNRLLTEDYLDDNSPEFSYHQSPEVSFFYDATPGPVDAGDGGKVSAHNTKGMLAYVQDNSARSTPLTMPAVGWSGQSSGSLTRSSPRISIPGLPSSSPTRQPSNTTPSIG